MSRLVRAPTVKSSLFQTDRLDLSIRLGNNRLTNGFNGSRTCRLDASCGAGPVPVFEAATGPWGSNSKRALQAGMLLPSVPTAAGGGEPHRVTPQF